MAQKEMPIFTRTFDFLTWLLPAINGFPRAHRRSGVVCGGSVANRRCTAGAVQREGSGSKKILYLRESGVFLCAHL